MCIYIYIYVRGCEAWERRGEREGLFLIWVIAGEHGFENEEDALLRVGGEKFEDFWLRDRAEL